MVADKLWMNTNEFFEVKDEDKRAKIKDILLSLLVIGWFLTVSG